MNRATRIATLVAPPLCQETARCPTPLRPKQQAPFHQQRRLLRNSAHLLAVPSPPAARSAGKNGSLTAVRGGLFAKRRIVTAVRPELLCGGDRPRAPQFAMPVVSTGKRGTPPGRLVSRSPQMWCKSRCLDIPARRSRLLVARSRYRMSQAQPTSQLSRRPQGPAPVGVVVTERVVRRDAMVVLPSTTDCRRAHI